MEEVSCISTACYASVNRLASAGWLALDTWMEPAVNGRGQAETAQL